MEIHDKSLDRWRFELKSGGRGVWIQFYKSMMGVNVSDYTRFYRALDSYGDWPLFEGILASSEKSLTGDPLPYVLKVTYEKWKVQQQERDLDTDYLESIKRAREITHNQNKALLNKLKKAQKLAQATPKRTRRKRGIDVS